MRKKIVKSEFGKNVLTLMTGTTISQVIPIALTPVLTRIFSPEEFGAYAFYMSLVTFFLVVAAGRYEQAIVLPKEDKDAINILGLSLSILIGFVILLGFLIFVFYTPIQNLLKNEAVGEWIWFVPITILLASLYRTFTFWSNRHKRFKGTSNSIILQTSSRVGIQLLGGLKKYGILFSPAKWGTFFKSIFAKGYESPIGVTFTGLGTLIVSYAGGFLIGTFVFLIPFLKKDRHLLKFLSWAEMKKQAKIYEKFPKINALHGLTDEVKNIGVTSTILFAFSEAILGFYSMTVRILSAPLSVLGKAFSQVFYQKAAEMHAHEQNFIPLIKSTVKKMLLIGAPIFLVILLFGPPLFDFVLGDEWRIAGVYAQCLTPWLFLSFAISPILQVSVILNKQGEYFFVSIIHNVLILGSILIGGVLFESLELGFLILSGAQIIFYFFVYRWAIRISEDSIKQYKSTDK